MSESRERGTLQKLQCLVLSVQNTNTFNSQKEKKKTDKYDYILEGLSQVILSN